MSVSILFYFSFPKYVRRVNCMQNRTECQLLCDSNDTSICSWADDIPSDLRLIVIYANNESNYDYSCITNKSEDFIYLNTSSVVDRYSLLPSLSPTILDIMCPLQEYTISITEIKIDTSSRVAYEAYNAPFVEIYNSNAFPISLEYLLFDGLINGRISTPTRWNVDQYLALYNADIGDVICQNCSCTSDDNMYCNDALYIPCGSAYDCSFNSSMVTLHILKFCAVIFVLVYIG